MVQQHAASIIAPYRSQHWHGAAALVKDKFDAFLESGFLTLGFLRLRCGECGHDKLLAFSCKRRAFCPSCGAKCMLQPAGQLVDQVTPGEVQARHMHKLRWWKGKSVRDSAVGYGSRVQAHSAEC